MADIERNDLINKFKDYQKAFCQMEEDEFLFKFRNALKSAEKQVEEWKNYLKQYTKLQNIMVKQMLGKDDSVYLADVFVELTIVERYDEMRQLALIPVNASLFAALLKEESVSIHSLTQLYDELTCYLIRQQLCRMGLEELAEVTNIQLFHRSVRAVSTQSAK